MSRRQTWVLFIGWLAMVVCVSFVSARASQTEVEQPDKQSGHVSVIHGHNLRVSVYHINGECFAVWENSGTERVRCPWELKR